MQIGSSQTCKYKPIKCIFAFLCWAVELALEYSWRRGLNHKPVKLVVVAQWCCFDRWWWCILLGWQIGVLWLNHLALDDLRLNLNPRNGDHLGSHHLHLWWQIGPGQRSGINHSQQSHCKSHEDYTLPREKLSISPQFEIIKNKSDRNPPCWSFQVVQLNCFFASRSFGIYKTFRVDPKRNI